MIKSDKKRRPRNGQKSQGTVPAFLQKTFEILENPIYSDIISWNKEGTAFVVKKTSDFAEKILPKYFKHNNFASFVRQLNMYDFHKAKHDNNENEFKHSMFKRGAKHLLGDIKRKTAENLPSPSPNQLVPVNKEFDFEKFKKDCNLFSNEMGTIKTRQGELEKITKVLFNQNNSLIKENKLLWNELLKSKDKYERKIEKLMYFIFSMMQYSGNPQISSFVQKKGIAPADLADALGDFEDDSEFKSKIGIGNTVSLLPDKGSKDQDKNTKKFLKMFQNKDDPNIESLIDNLPDPNKLLSNYPGLGDEEEIHVDAPIIGSKKKGRTKKAANFDDDSFDEVMPSKKVAKNEYIDKSDIDIPTKHETLIEDVPPLYAPQLQRGYSDSDNLNNMRMYNGYNTKPLQLTNGNLESPKAIYSDNTYPNIPYHRDQFGLERNPSDGPDYFNTNVYSPLRPRSPGIFNREDEFE